MLYCFQKFTGTSPKEKKNLKNEYQLKVTISIHISSFMCIWVCSIYYFILTFLWEPKPILVKLEAAKGGGGGRGKISLKQPFSVKALHLWKLLWKQLKKVPYNWKCFGTLYCVIYCTHKYIFHSIIFMNHSQRKYAYGTH